MANQPKKKTTPKAAEIEPVDAAIDEINDKEVMVEFRGQKYVIPRATFLSVPFSMAIIGGQITEIAHAILSATGPNGVKRFVDSCDPTENAFDASFEFVTAVNALAGQGNSSPS